MTESQPTPPAGYFSNHDRRSSRPLVLTAIFFLLFGIVIGGWIFAKTQPRALIALRDCDHCLSPADLAGLLGSVGMMRFGGLLPFVLTETDKSVVIKYPLLDAKIHYVIVPKKDIKDIGRIDDNDLEYVADAVRIARYLIRKENLRAYRLFTNGPGLQSVTYLHFHLVSNERRKVAGDVETELSAKWHQHTGISQLPESVDTSK